MNRKNRNEEFVPESDKPLPLPSDTMPATARPEDTDSSSKPNAASTPSSAVYEPDVNMTEAPTTNEAGPEHANHAGSDTMQNFGRQSRELIKVIQRLESLSIDATLPSLPKFVVVGDQSHGKSSIIEAICDLSLPRNTGTCTRCPFQITTSAAEPGTPWSCRISLALHHMHVPTSRGPRNAPPWKNRGEQMELVEFTTVRDRNDLERVLRLAQIAILNPNLNPQTVLQNSDLEQGISVSFSPNVIRLHIQAPELPELSFFDLPGAINMHHDQKEEHVVHFIENLIKSYVKDEKALILLAISSNQDVETSTAYRYVHHSDADDRCLGVLTKPDLITTSNVQIPKIFRGEMFQLGHGWFTAKQPSQDELEEGVTHAQARLREADFFATQKPWSTFLKEFSPRFGTRNLQATLSNKLINHILNELPDILGRVNCRIGDIEAELAQFPEQTKAPCQAVSKEIDNLQSHIVKQLLGQGHGEEKAFRNNYKSIIRRFRTELGDAVPEVSLSTPGFEHPSIDLDGDDEEMDMDETPSKSRKKNNGQKVATPQRTPTSQRTQPRPQRTPAKSEYDGGPQLSRLSFTLDKLKKDFEYGSVSSDLPNQLDAGVTENLSISFLKSWSQMLENMLDRVRLAVGKMLITSIQNVLSTRLQTKLHEEVRVIVEAQLNEVLEEVTGHVRHALACELLRPISYDLSVDKRVTEMRAKLLEKRNTVRVNEHFERLDAQTNRQTPSAERAKKAADTTWVQSTLGADSYTRELAWISIPLAYYEVASRRFVDHVAINLEYGLINGLEKNLKDRLETDLRVTDPDYCAQLLAEDPRREQERRRLQMELQKLYKALKELKGLPMMG